MTVIKMNVSMMMLTPAPVMVTSSGASAPGL